MQNTVTNLLGIDVPIFAFSHCRDVVAAVSKAGGLGVLGAVAHSPEQLEIDLKWIEDEIGPDKPYGVDLIIPAKYAGDEAGGYTMADVADLIPPQYWEKVDEILARYEVPPLADDAGVVFGVTKDSPRTPRGPSSTSRSPTAPRSWPTPSARRPST